MRPNTTVAFKCDVYGKAELLKIHCSRLQLYRMSLRPICLQPYPQDNHDSCFVCCCCAVLADRVEFRSQEGSASPPSAPCRRSQVAATAHTRFSFTFPLCTDLVLGRSAQEQLRKSEYQQKYFLQMKLTDDKEWNSSTNLSADLTDIDLYWSIFSLWAAELGFSFLVIH